MTMRSLLDRRLRWMMAVTYAGIALFAGTILVCQAVGQQPLPLIAVPGFFVAFLTLMLGQFFAFRCNRCRGNLAPMVMYRAGFSVNPRIQFCPYCGRGLDEEIEAD